MDFFKYILFKNVSNSIMRNVACSILTACSFCLLKTLTEGLEWCGLFGMFYQLFGPSFWRHPFTAEHPLLRHGCNAVYCLFNNLFPSDLNLGLLIRAKSIFPRCLSFKITEYCNKMFAKNLQSKIIIFSSESVFFPSSSDQFFGGVLWWCFSLSVVDVTALSSH